MAELIDRQAVLAEIGEFQIRFNETGDSHERVAYASAEHCMLVIKAAPTIEAEPVRHGRWDEIYCFSEHGIPMAQYECTNCGHDIERQRGVVPPYCEFCGARMDGGE